MLSGGERALTAVALLFAMLEVRPVPFCVLDEVDAALDEANVGRFSDALRSLADRTQFIVITHNRGTIEAADALYGVTVGDDSVSRVISLRLDEAQAIADRQARRLERSPTMPLGDAAATSSPRSADVLAAQARGAATAGRGRAETTDARRRTTTRSPTDGAVGARRGRLRARRRVGVRRAPRRPNPSRRAGAEPICPRRPSPSRSSPIVEPAGSPRRTASRGPAAGSCPGSAASSAARRRAARRGTTSRRR